MQQKKKLILSFSMGETSALMTQWCLENLKDEYEMVAVVANTGDEHEESLIFADRCDKYWGWDLVWIEAVTNPKFGIGVKAKVVDFDRASRNGEPFEAMIAKHGIPNESQPHCSRELKQEAIKSYARVQLGWKNYYVAIGIRCDEEHRVDWKSAKKNRWIYPFITHVKADKPRINIIWNKLPFRLPIKSYQGNCKHCWKFSLRKQMTKAVEFPESFDFPKRMEGKYGDYVPAHKIGLINTPVRFYRGNRSVTDIFEEAKLPFDKAVDERTITNKQYFMWDQELDENFGCTESCEAFQT
jgi:hypothetical protein